MSSARSLLLVEVIKKVADNGIRHLVLVCPNGFITKDPIKTSNHSAIDILSGVRMLDSTEGVYQLLADVFSCVKNIIPMCSIRDFDGGIFHHADGEFWATLLTVLVIFLVSYIANTFEEDKREDVILVC